MRIPKQPAGTVAALVLVLTAAVLLILSNTAREQVAAETAPLASEALPSGNLPSDAPTPTATHPFPSAPTTAPRPPGRIEQEVDLVVYGSTTSGLGVLRGLGLARAAYPQDLRVALVTPCPTLESPLAQGLSVEDTYRPGTEGGFYGEFRAAVISHYSRQGIQPLTTSNRLLYESEVADRVLRQLAFGSYDAGSALYITVYCGQLLEASDDGEQRSVLVAAEDGSEVLLDTRYFVDASVEGDLARKLGADYYLGTSSTRYNDRDGNPAPPPGESEGRTAPQALSALLTLTSSPDPAPAVSNLPYWGARLDGSAGDGLEGVGILSSATVKGFATSWTLRYTLPHGKHELNEAWSDHLDPDASYTWFMYPETRRELAESITLRVLSLVGQLQRSGYGNIGVASVPTWPYVRGELMVRGRRLFALEELTPDQVDHPLAQGTYAVFDRHDALRGSEQDSQGETVCLPMEATIPLGQPRLLVSTAYSVDWRAYNSALRMETMRANAGAACGVMIAIACAQGLDVDQIDYAEVRAELERQGHDLD